MKATKRIKFGQPSWRIATKVVEAFITETGGHFGPVTFHLGNKKIQPYAIAPWAQQKTGPSLPPVLKVLRGDFFYLPFGGNPIPFKGERHPPHGETANERWSLESAAPGALHLSMKTNVRRGRVDKRILLREDHTAVYQQYIISGMSGLMSLGHHAMLKFSGPSGIGKISTSRFVRGEVVPVQLENPAEGGYSCLRAGYVFRSLEKVAIINGGYADLTKYPARCGYEDIALIVSDLGQPVAWTAVTFPQEAYVWFALRDPKILRETVFWISNGGRHYEPWNGRHVNVLGLEEVTAYFHYGLAESAAKNRLAMLGYPTYHRLDPEAPLVVNYIRAVSSIPKGFDRVATITPAKNQWSVELADRSGRTLIAALDLNFLNLNRAEDLVERNF